jgi:hypothetical protein
MQVEQGCPRELTPSERRIAVAVGIVMLVSAFLSVGVLIGLAVPIVQLVEGLSK